MRVSRIGRRTSWLIVGLACLVMAAGMLATRPDSRVEAGVRRTAPAEHFKSGAQRSEQLLTQILGTLQRMDERMARIERSINKATNAPRIAVPSELERKP